MISLTEVTIRDAFLNAGFVAHPTTSHLFLTKMHTPISPAFYSRISKRGGKTRLGGAIGLYFEEFEKSWSASMTKKERQAGFTLPMIMMIDNYQGLVRDGIFEPIGSYQDLIEHSEAIYRLCNKLPSSRRQLNNTLAKGRILDIELWKYLHIQQYNLDSNPYLIKSTKLIEWLRKNWHDTGALLFDALTDEQSSRLRR